MLETVCHESNVFVTLTYAEDFIPRLPGTDEQSSPSTVLPKHFQKWLKRLRVAVEPRKIRFYGVGEYGDETGRAHYHAVIFGGPRCFNHRTRRKPGTNVPDPRNCCPSCRLVQATWPYGVVELGEVNTHSAAYLASYTVKKMTKKDDQRLKGRHPEFARMSLRPGVGADAMWDVSSQMIRFQLDELLDDVPNALRHGAGELPLGRYLTRKLREQIGRSPDAPKWLLEKIEEELRPLREAAFNNSRSFKEEVVEANKQKVLNMEAKHEIYKKRNVL